MKVTPHTLQTPMNPWLAASGLYSGQSGVAAESGIPTGPQSSVSVGAVTAQPTFGRAQASPFSQFYQRNSISQSLAWQSNSYPGGGGQGISNTALYPGDLLDLSAATAPVQESVWGNAAGAGSGVLPADKHLMNSDLRNLIRQSGIRDAVVEFDPKAPLSPVNVKITQTNGEKNTLFLMPNRVDQFIKLLEEGGPRPIPYSVTPASDQYKMAKEVGNILAEIFVPTVILGGTGLAGFKMFQWFQEWQTTQKVREAFEKAVISSKDKGSYPDIYKLLEGMEGNPSDNEVHQLMNKLLSGSRDVAVVTGPPGNGKSYRLLALIQHLLNQDDSTLAVRIDKGVGNDVLGMLYDMYSGDQKLAKNAQKILQKLNGDKPVKRLICFVEEFERSNQDMLEEIVTKAKGNPEQRVAGNPEMIFIANANHRPTFLNDPAISNRSEAALLEARSPKEVGEIFYGYLQGKTKVDLDRLQVKPALVKLFEEYPGVSVRTAAQTISVDSAHAIDRLDAPSAANVTDIVRRQLESYHLDNSELASLMIQTFIEVIQKSRFAVGDKGTHKLYLSMYAPAISATKDRTITNPNGKESHQTIVDLVHQLRRTHGSSYNIYRHNEDKAVLRNLITEVEGNFNRYQLQQYQQGLHSSDPATQRKYMIIDTTARFIDAQIAHIQSENTMDESAEVALKHLHELQDAFYQVPEPNSLLGRTVALVAEEYHNLETEYEEDLEEAGTTPDKALETALQNALTYDPSKHTERNNFKNAQADDSTVTRFIFFATLAMVRAAMGATEEELLGNS